MSTSSLSTRQSQDDETARLELEAVLADIDANPWPTDIGEARILYDKMGPPMAADIRAEQYLLGGVPAQTLTPPESDADRLVLFLHGGGYTYGSYLSHQGMAAEVARAARCKCVQPNYRLSPENPYPAGVEDVRAAYEALLAEGWAPKKIAFVGDSAGAGMAMSALLALKEAGRPLPGAAVCISPWVDLESNGESFRTHQSIDPMIDRELCLRLAKDYCRDIEPSSPRVSAIHGDLAGLPPMLVQVGEREVLLSDAETLADRARAASVDVMFEKWPQMVHVWHLYFHMLGKGREAIARVGAFVKEKTS